MTETLVYFLLGGFCGTLSASIIWYAIVEAI